MIRFLRRNYADFLVRSGYTLLVWIARKTVAVIATVEYRQSFSVVRVCTNLWAQCYCIFAGLTKAAKINTPSHWVLDVLCIWFIEVDWSHSFVVGRSMVFAVVVSKVAAARFPVDWVLVLVDSILKPVESHLHGFALALFACVVEDALANLIVSDDWGWRLGVAKEF